MDKRFRRGRRPAKKTYGQGRFSRLDSAENAFIERQLEFVRAQTYDVLYPELLSRQMIPVDNTVDPGAETVKYNQYDWRGVAKILASYADDLPRADVLVKEFRQAIKGLASAYAYSIQDIRAARMAGVPLEQRKATAARSAIERRIDKIGALGDSAYGLNGLLTCPNANSYVIPAGQAGGTTWLDAVNPKTGSEILDDMTQATNVSVDLTNGVEVPSIIAIPLKQYGVIATRPLQIGSPVTILQHFLAANPYISQVIPWYRLKAAGAGATDRMLIYRRSPEKLELVIPQEFEQFPPEQEGLEFEVACHARIGGVVYYYPLSITYADGI